MKMSRKFWMGAMGLALAASSAHAGVIGYDPFNYADGDIAGKTGGTGWLNEITDEAGAPASQAADWSNLFGTSNVVSGAIVTNGSGAIRQYNGLGEGSGFPSNEREGAIRATGKLFYSVRINRSVGTDWSGISSYDFGSERIFFGVTGGQGAQKFFGVQAYGDDPNPGTTLSGVPVVDGQEYFLVASVDFDADKISLWVNPGAGDEATPAVTRGYTSGNWSTAVRLGSGSATTWDDVKVTTSFAEAVPEPGSLSLLGLGVGAMLFRRGRR